MSLLLGAWGFLSQQQQDQGGTRKQGGRPVGWIHGNAHLSWDTAASESLPCDECPIKRGFGAAESQEWGKMCENAPLPLIGMPQPQDILGHAEQCSAPSESSLRIHGRCAPVSGWDLLASIISSSRLVPGRHHSRHKVNRH